MHLSGYSPEENAGNGIEASSLIVRFRVLPFLPTFPVRKLVTILGPNTEK